MVLVKKIFFFFQLPTWMSLGVQVSNILAGYAAIQACYVYRA